MMEAKELRIGNWIKFERHLCKVDAICDYHNIKRVSIKNEHFGGTISFEEVNPIPLATEILIACGFKLDHDGVWYCNIRVNFKIFYDLEQVCIEQTLLEVRIKYLHQLQNLYYALTSTELKVNLEKCHNED